VPAWAAPGEAVRQVGGGQAVEKEAVMGWKPKVTVKLIKCGTCGRSYNNPLTHVCKIRLDRPARRRGKAKRR
jgi:hypothetical protein